MRIERVALDMDGVLTDFVKQICKAHGRSNPYSNPDNFGLFDMDKIWNMKPAHFWGVCDYSFWRTMDWMYEGKELVALLSDLVGEDNIGIVTSPSSNDGCYDGKRDWIKDHLPTFKRRYLPFSDKTWVAKPDVLLIDDRDENIHKFHEAGGQTFLVPRPWNSAHARVNDNWLISLERLFLGANFGR